MTVVYTNSFRLCESHWNPHGMVGGLSWPARSEIATLGQTLRLPGHTTRLSGQNAAGHLAPTPDSVGGRDVRSGERVGRGADGRPGGIQKPLAQALATRPFQGPESVRNVLSILLLLSSIHHHRRSLKLLNLRRQSHLHLL